MWCRGEGVMGDALDIPQVHGKKRLNPFQSMDLRVIVEADYHCLVRRIQVEANAVLDLFQKQPFIIGLEVLLR